MSFSTIFRNLELQAMHSKLAAALAGNPAEDEEHHGKSKKDLKENSMSDYFLAD